MSLLVSIIVMIHLVRFRPVMIAAQAGTRPVMIAAQAGTRPVVTTVRVGHHLTFNYYLRLCKYEDNKNDEGRLVQLRNGEIAKILHVSNRQMMVDGIYTEMTYTTLWVFSTLILSLVANIGCL